MPISESQRQLTHWRSEAILRAPFSPADKVSRVVLERMPRPGSRHWLSLCWTLRPVIPWTRRLSFKAPSSLPVGLGQPQAVHGGACLGRATATPSPGRARPGRVWPGRARAGRARPAAFGPAAPSNTSLVWHRSARAGLAGPARACLPVLGRWGPTRAQLGPN